jgi:hypothetical protein
MTPQQFGDRLESNGVTVLYVVEEGPQRLVACGISWGVGVVVNSGLSNDEPVTVLALERVPCGPGQRFEPTATFTPPGD